MIPGGAKGNLFQEAYTLGPLLPDSSYEAKVSAKNKYGWSESSDVFQFYTQGKGEWGCFDAFLIAYRSYCFAIHHASSR